MSVCPILRGRVSAACSGARWRGGRGSALPITRPCAAGVRLASRTLTGGACECCVLARARAVALLTLSHPGFIFTLLLVVSWTFALGVSAVPICRLACPFPTPPFYSLLALRGGVLCRGFDFVREFAIFLEYSEQKFKILLKYHDRAHIFR